MKFSAIITAGGTSSRFGNTNKLLEKIDGKEIIRHTVDAFVKASIEDIVICANVSIISILSDIFADYIKELADAIVVKINTAECWVVEWTN